MNYPEPRYGVELTLEEENEAIRVGEQRYYENRGSRQSSVLFGRSSLTVLESDTMGARGEKAASKFFGIHWDGRFFKSDQWKQWRLHGRDVGMLEVKTSRFRFSDLKVQWNQNPNAPYVLVLEYDRPLYWLIGWMWGYEAQQQKYWKDYGYNRPCFGVPQQHLRDIGELVLLMREVV